MRRISFAAALATVAVVSPLSAQTWQAIGVPSNTNTGAYWNNQSYGTPTGGVVCNVGAVLTNTPMSTGSCPNQLTAFLPITPTPLTTSNVFLGGAAGAEPGIGGFRFAAGTYNISRLGGIAAAGSAAWGVVTDAGISYSAAILSAGNTTITGPFAIWITEALPVAGGGVTYTSDRRTGAVAMGSRGTTLLQQHAVFTNGTGLGNLGSLSTDAFGTIINSTGVGATYYVGMEDLSNGGRGFATAGANPISDRDYQDVLIRIQAVPEPATIGLMGFGLLALAGVAKRRKA